MAFGRKRNVYCTGSFTEIVTLYVLLYTYTVNVTISVDDPV